MHSFQKPWALLVSLSLMFSVGGCDFMKKLKKKEKEEATAEAADSPERSTQKGGPKQRGPNSLGVPDRPSAPEDNPDQALGDKLNHPIECINGISMGVSRSHERYLGWVKDAKSGPIGTEKIVYGLYELLPNQIDSCKRELNTLAAAPTPATPDLDKAAQDYVVKLDAVTPLVAEAHKYYDLKNYEDDKFAKGKTMHGPLMAAFEAFEASAETLHKEVSKLKAGLAERELERLEKTEGRKLTWHRQKLMLLAKVVADVGDVEDAKLDVAKLETAVKDLEDIDTALEAYVKANPGEAKGMFSMFTGEAQDFLKAAKELHRRVRDKKPFSTGDLMMLEGNSGWMVDGTQQKLIHAYNDLVNSSNQLNDSPF